MEAKLAQCEHCGEPIKSPDAAIHDGEHWFCTYKCMGAWSNETSGGVPA